MDKPLASSRPVDEAVIERLFMAMHAYFGNPFLDKFRSGTTNDQGIDEGIVNAKRVWNSELQGYTMGELHAALRNVRDSGAAFAPSLPEFLQACRANRRARDERTPDRPALPPGVARQRLIERREWQEMKPAGGLMTLITVTAHAVAQAGGDEVSTLRELEQRYTRGRAT